MLSGIKLVNLHANVDAVEWLGHLISLSVVWRYYDIIH